MPVDNHHDPGDDKPVSSEPTRPAVPRRRVVSRRNAILVAIGLALGLIALGLVALIAYRLGYVDRYIADQVKTTLSNYGIRAEIKSFHTSINPQTVELQGSRPCGSKIFTRYACAATSI
jgi:hypothetical protein